MYVCVGVGRRPPQSRRLSRQRCTLACTRYCYNQYCMVYVIQKGHRGGVVYCAIIVQAREEAASASSTQMAEVRVGLYTILFHFKALLWEPIILACPPHLQSLPYCNTIARLLRNIRPPPPPRCLCYMLYTIQCWLCQYRVKAAHISAFTRYCYDQYCMVYGIQQGGREGVVYWPIVVQQYYNSVGNAGGPEE